MRYSSFKQERNRIVFILRFFFTIPESASKNIFLFYRQFLVDLLLILMRSHMNESILELVMDTGSK